MSAKTKCVTKIKEAVGDAFTRDEINQVIDGLESLVDSHIGVVQSYDRRLARKIAAKTITADELLQRAIEKRQRVGNILRERELDAVLASSRRKASREISRLLVGAIDGKEMGGVSIDAQALSMDSRWIGALLADAQAAGVEHRVVGRGLFRRVDPEFDYQVRVEMRILNGDTTEVPTNNAEAVKVARIYNKYIEERRVQENLAGAYIAKRSDYDSSQTHDPLRVSRAAEILGSNVRGLTRQQALLESRRAWVDWIAPRLKEETFVGVTNRREFLERVFDNLASGNHMAEPGTVSTGDFKFIGPGNLAKRLSSQRVLHFRTARDAWEYNQHFGQGSLFDNVAFSLQKGARNVATMRVLGVNPEAMLTKIVEKQIAAAKAAGDINEVQRLETAMNRKSLTPTLRAQYESATGLNAVPGNPTWARRFAAARMMVSMMRLGGMVLSSFPDLGIRAAQLTRNGVGVLDAATDGIRSLARGRGSLERQQALGILGVGFDGIRGTALARWTAGDNTPGIMSKLMNTYFRLNLSAWWQDSLMQGFGEAMAKNLAYMSNRTFDALPDGLRTIMRSYGIEAADWDVIRTSGKRTVDGSSWLIGDGITDENVARKLALYYSDQARSSMTMGGAAEAAWTANFGPPGSLPGEAARFMLQFKQYPLTFARRQLLGGIQTGNYAGVAQMIVMTTILGYASKVAKDLARFKEPESPVGPDAGATWMNALLTGGGLGIYGDFLLGEYDRYGRSVGETIAGPSVSVAANWLKVFREIARAGVDEDMTFGKAGADLYKTTVNSLPFGNLFYARVALDYLILYNLQEMVDPGSLERMEKSAMDATGQGYLIRPTQALGAR